MDPLSITAGVVGLCAFSGKLIATLSSFVDDVQDAPKEVRALSGDLAAFYSAFTCVRLAVEALRLSSIPEGWASDFERLTVVCEETLQQIKEIVDEAVATETTSRGAQVWRTVKITFKFTKLEVLRLRLVSQVTVLSVSLEALDESRGQHGEQRFEDIHSKVDALVASRGKVKEVLVVLDNDHESADKAQDRLQDRTSRDAGAANEVTKPERQRDQVETKTSTQPAHEEASPATNDSPLQKHRTSLRELFVCWGLVFLLLLLLTLVQREKVALAKELSTCQAIFNDARVELKASNEALTEAQRTNSEEQNRVHAQAHRHYKEECVSEMKRCLNEAGESRARLYECEKTEKEGGEALAACHDMLKSAQSRLSTEDMADLSELAVRLGENVTQG